MGDTLHTATQLKRARQQTVHRSNFPKAVREKNVQEKMNHYKTKMKEAVQINDTANIKNLYHKLIEIRAEQLALRIEDDNGIMTRDQSTLEKEMKNYYTDCYRLQIHLKPLFSK